MCVRRGDEQGGGGGGGHRQEQGLGWWLVWHPHTTSQYTAVTQTQSSTPVLHCHTLDTTQWRRTRIEIQRGFSVTISYLTKVLLLLRLAKPILIWLCHRKFFFGQQLYVYIEIHEILRLSIMFIKYFQWIESTEVFCDESDIKVSD